MQLDLFTHTRDVALRNDVIAALRARDACAARQALSMLAAAYPQDGLLAPLALLLNSVSDPPERFASAETAQAAALLAGDQLVPAARRVLGAEAARDWLVPLWRSLANAAAGLPFDEHQPLGHAAALLLRSGDWALAEARVAGIPSWRRRPAPLAWMAEIRLAQGGLEAAFALLAELAWIDAARFGALARRLESRSLTRLMDGFERGFEPRDDAQDAWFPAWALVDDPSLAAPLREAQVCGDSAPERTARLVMEMLALERQGRHAQLVVLRQRLRDADSRLFARYMSSR
ncbi:MAG: hypothetical protein IT514_14265 [Burkholderiales bacterium]|nr:hypothetical protein [Burkholderiales bacterium]